MAADNPTAFAAIAATKQHYPMLLSRSGLAVDSCPDALDVVCKSYAFAVCFDREWWRVSSRCPGVREPAMGQRSTRPHGAGKSGAPADPARVLPS